MSSTLLSDIDSQYLSGKLKNLMKKSINNISIFARRIDKLQKSSSKFPEINVIHSKGKKGNISTKNRFPRTFATNEYRLVARDKSYFHFYLKRRFVASYSGICRPVCRIRHCFWNRGCSASWPCGAWRARWPE